MGGTAQYLHFGFILISVANLIVIALLIVVFVLAVTLRPRMLSDEKRSPSTFSNWKWEGMWERVNPRLVIL
jgi:hypothetical protein